MGVEIALLVLTACGTFVALMTLIDEGPIEPDGGDDPGPIALILAIYGSVAAFVAAAILILVFEAARLAFRAHRRRSSSRSLIA
jgi:hypothetical protein